MDSQSPHLVFVLDTTGSMSVALSGCKNAIHWAAKLFSILGVRIQFVMYGDYDNNLNRKKILYKSEVTTVLTGDNIDDLLVKLSLYKISQNGNGGDAPEALLTAWNVARTLCIEGGIIIVITDAMPHINQFESVEATKEFNELNRLGLPTNLHQMILEDVNKFNIAFISSAAYYSEFQRIDSRIISIHTSISNENNLIKYMFQIINKFIGEESIDAIHPSVEDAIGFQLSNIIEPGLNIPDNYIDVFQSSMKQNNYLLPFCGIFSKWYFISIRKEKKTGAHSEFVKYLISAGVNSNVIKKFKDAATSMLDWQWLQTTGTSVREPRITSVNGIEMSQIIEMLGFAGPMTSQNLETISSWIKSIKISENSSDLDWKFGIPMSLVKDGNGLKLIASCLSVNPELTASEFGGAILPLLTCAIIRWCAVPELVEVAKAFVASEKYMQWAQSAEFEIPDPACNQAPLQFIQTTISDLNPKLSVILNKLIRVIQIARLVKEGLMSEITVIARLKDLNVNQIAEAIMSITMAYDVVLDNWFVANLFVKVPFEDVLQILQRNGKDLPHVVKLSEKLGYLYLSTYAINNYKDEYMTEQVIKDEWLARNSKIVNMSNYSELETFYLDRVGKDGENIFSLANLVPKSEMKAGGPQTCQCRKCKSFYMRQDSSHLASNELMCFECREIRWICASSRGDEWDKPRHSPTEEQKQIDGPQVIDNCSVCSGSHKISGGMYPVKCNNCDRIIMSGFRLDSGIDKMACCFCQIDEVEKILVNVRFEKVVCENLEYFVRRVGIPVEILSKLVSNRGSTSKAIKNADGITEPTLFAEHGWNVVLSSDEKKKIFCSSNVISEKSIEMIEHVITEGFRNICSMCYDSFHITQLKSFCGKCDYRFCQKCVSGTLLLEPGSQLGAQHVSCPTCGRASRACLVKHYGSLQLAIGLKCKTKSLVELVKSGEEVSLCSNGIECCSKTWPFHQKAHGGCVASGEDDTSLEVKICQDCYYRGVAQHAAEIERNKLSSLDITALAKKDADGFWILQENGYEIKFRKCPHCSTPIERFGTGCWHMTCISCRGHFAWDSDEKFSNANDVYVYLQNKYNSIYGPRSDNHHNYYDDDEYDDDYDDEI